MTDRMRKALELIASGEGPQGGFLTRVQMIGIAAYALTPDEVVTDAIKRASIPENLEARLPGYGEDDEPDSDSPLMRMWKDVLAFDAEAKRPRLNADYDPETGSYTLKGWTEPEPEPRPPMIVRDLLK